MKDHVQINVKGSDIVICSYYNQFNNIVLERRFNLDGQQG